MYSPPNHNNNNNNNNHNYKYKENKCNRSHSANRVHGGDNEYNHVNGNSPQNRGKYNSPRGGGNPRKQNNNNNNNNNYHRNNNNHNTYEESPKKQNRGRNK